MRDAGGTQVCFRDVASPRLLPHGIGVAVLLALIVGTPPALRAMRLNIVDALADKR